MRGFLGFSRTQLSAVVVGSLTVGAAIGFALPSPELPECGWTVEEGRAVPAACSDSAELDRRMDEIRAERTGGRFITEHEAWMDFSADCDELAPPERGYCVEVRTQEWRERGN